MADTFFAWDFKELSQSAAKHTTQMCVYVILVMALKSYHSFSLLVKAWFPNTENTVRVQWENYFNTISMLYECVGEGLSLGVLLLVMGLGKWSKCPVVAVRHFCGVFLQENGSLGQLRGQRFLPFLVVYIFPVCECKKVC